jgi:biotin transporter BioY
MNYLTNTPVSIARTFQIAFLPFVVPDALKAAAAGALAHRAIPLLREGGLLPK